jgi:hypothetical protein
MSAKIDLNAPKNLPVAAAHTPRHAAARANRIPPALDIGRPGLEAWP